MRGLWMGRGSRADYRTRPSQNLLGGLRRLPRLARFGNVHGPRFLDATRFPDAAFEPRRWLKHENLSAFVTHGGTLCAR